MFAKRKEKQVDAIKKFDALLTTAMGACDLIPEIEQILESHYKKFQKTQDVDRERARLCNALTPYAINWRLITLHYCSGFCQYIDMNQPWVVFKFLRNCQTVFHQVYVFSLCDSRQRMRWL